MSEALGPGRRCSSARWWAPIGSLAVTVVALGLSFHPEAARASASDSTASDTALVRLGKGGTALVRLAKGGMAFVAWPKGSGSVPALIVVHDREGLDASTRDLAHRWAREGYAVVVPDLYHGRAAADSAGASALASGLTLASTLADLHAAARWLSAQPRTRGSSSAVLGVGSGGPFAQAFASDTSRVSAVILLSAAPDVDSARVARLRVPIQAHFGAHDARVPLTRVGAFQSALKRTGRAGEVWVYPGAGHGFIHAATPAYDADAARRTWGHMLEFLAQHLKP